MRKKRLHLRKEIKDFFINYGIILLFYLIIICGFYALAERNEQLEKYYNNNIGEVER